MTGQEQNEHLNNILKNDFITEKLLKNVEQNQQYESVISLLNNITNDKERTNDKIFILTAAYDKINKKYNGISLVVLVLSSIATLLEALRLSIMDFVSKNSNVNTESISFTMNILILFIGTIITIASSIIRFRNYREILEQLKDSRALLISYRDKYNKKYQKVLNLLAIDTLNSEDIQQISDKINDYDDAIKSINVLQYLRNDDVLKFNKYKAFFDFEMRKIDIDKQVAIKKYEMTSGINELDKGKEIQVNEKISKMNRYASIEKLKLFLNSKLKKSNPEEINLSDLQENFA